MASVAQGGSEEVSGWGTRSKGAANLGQRDTLRGLHQMRRHIERTGNEFREGAPDFDRLHKGFHTALLAACGSKRLLTAHSDLYDQAYRYRRVMMRSFDSGKKFVAVHDDLAECVLARDIDGARAMLASHLHSTLDIVYPPAKKDRS